MKGKNLFDVSVAGSEVLDDLMAVILADLTVAFATVSLALMDKPMQETGRRTPRHSNNIVALHINKHEF